MLLAGVQLIKWSVPRVSVCIYLISFHISKLELVLMKCFGGMGRDPGASQLHFLVAIQIICGSGVRIQLISVSVKDISSYCQWSTVSNSKQAKIFCPWP